MISSVEAQTTMAAEICSGAREKAKGKGGLFSNPGQNVSLMGQAQMCGKELWGSVQENDVVKLVGPTQFIEDVHEVFGLEFAPEKGEFRKEPVTKHGLLLNMNVKIGKNIPAASIAILLPVFSGGTAKSSQPMERNRSHRGKGSF